MDLTDLQTYKDFGSIVNSVITSSPQTCAEDLFYNPANKSFIHPVRGGRFTEVNDNGAKRFLKACGVKSEAIDAFLFKAQSERSIAYCGPLAGYKAGAYLINTNPVLVDSSPVWIPGEQGSWGMVMGLLINMLSPLQMQHFCYWLGFARQSISQRIHIPGQALVLAGPAGSGKSLTQDQIITPLLGGRKGNPFPFLSGRTPFNAELLGYEHLAIADQTSHTDYHSRREFGERLKDIVANTGHRCERKYGMPVELDPFWRVSISLNDEPENLQILPPIEESLADKLMIFLINKVPMPMPTGSPQERRDFANEIRSQLPAFIHSFEDLIPDGDFLDSRYGVRAYHNPVITGALQEMTPEEQLKDLLLQVLITDTWEGTATELHRKLCADGAMSRQAYTLFRDVSTLDNYIARLSKLYGAAIRRSPRSNRGRGWEIDTTL